MSAILILNYHRITEERDVIDPRFLPFTLANETFQQHLRLISELRIPVADLANPDSANPCAPLSVAFTFDDGHSSDLNYVIPALSAHGFPATFFPVTDLIGKNGYLGWEELADVCRQGFGIGSHSISHRPLHRLLPAGLQHEVAGSKQQLEDRLGRPVDLFAIPYGRTTHSVERSIGEAGYKHAFSTEFGFNPSDGCAFVMKRWNIRRTTTTAELEQVLKRRPLPVSRLYIRSAIRKQVDRVGDGLIPHKNR
jgi:peptidoglycan/xylan/chitin deacetylase (PgdA/CDA1 family)